jgi:PIN domain nuclease of toxin-antitoxin system
LPTTNCSGPDVLCLADTHVLIWAVALPERLPAPVREILEDPGNQVTFSPVSLWEVSVKFALGKLDLGGRNPEDLLQAVRDSGFTELPVRAEAMATSHRLARRSKDPFDRLLIWQAIRDGATFLTADRAARLYVQDGLRLP